MSTRARKPVYTPNISDSKLAMIRSGKKKKTVTGFKENKNITFSNDAGKFVAVQKEKKFEEAGVTRKKRNFIMFESKLGTERDTDITKIGGPDRYRAIQPRVDEKIIQKRKRKEYLDNFQYLETKDFKKNPSKPSIVIHQRLGNIYGATVEETEIYKTTSNVKPTSSSVEKNKPGEKMKSILKQNKSSSNLRSRQPVPSSATNARTTTSKIGRRSGPNATQTQTQTQTKTRTTTTKGGETKTQTRTTTTTTTTRGKK